MELRPYQHHGLEEIRHEFRKGARRVLMVLPTGGGKTVMFSAMARGHAERGGTVAVVVHRRELVAQAHRTLEAQGLAVGSRGLNAAAPVQVETVQAVIARGSAPPGTLAIIDEAHHYAGTEQWKAIPRVYANAKIVGATATPERADGTPLGEEFDAMVVVAQIRDLIKLGHLVPCEVFAPKVAREGKTLELSPVDAYFKYAPGTSAVVFAPHVKAAQDFAAKFDSAGTEARVITGNTRAEYRDEWLFRFERGSLKVLVNVHVLTEGWDAPIAETCILARKVGHAGSYLQMVGRVLRPHPGKTSAKLLDLYGTNVEAHGPPDEDRVFSLHGNAIAKRNGPGFCKVHGLPVPCVECDRTPGELATPGDAGGELDKWQRFQETHKAPDKRVAFLAALMRTAKRRGHKPGWAKMIYKGKMRHFPTKEVCELAEAQVAGEFAIGERDAG